MSELNELIAFFDSGPFVSRSGHEHTFGVALISLGGGCAEVS
jgi:hypothetical protein